MASITRRKPYKYKQDKVTKPPKTSRTEMSAVQRAFVVGAIVASRDGYASANALSKRMPQTQSGLSRLVQRRGRDEILTQEQKDAIIAIATSTRNNREKQSWQAIKDGDFKDVAPEISVTTFENVMYEAGYSRRRPGWKPPLTPNQERERYRWALAHNPDKYEYGDGLGFDFKQVIFTDETPARIGEERGMQRVWCKEDERYDNYVKKDRNRKDCCLQFYGAFRYNYKGPCYTYFEETEEEKRSADKALRKENAQRNCDDNILQGKARVALQVLQESDVNQRYNTRKKQYVPSQHDYRRGGRTRGGVDGYRHREGALKAVVPWINSLKEKGIPCLLLQDGAPAHKSRISRDYLTVERIESMWWPGHSPEVNASEHAWPWIRRHITTDFKPSCNAHQCRDQWEREWEEIPIETINRWVMLVPEMVRRIIRHGGKNDFHG
ncbi:hypothetical protein BU23DRAFT_568679 [Bimuria novae-zelandiae CBS 107.79]|uniref:Tc1-like transposase DDE domain-containing protein n=1 Tax=Bimuria novae-zelandiae CBS 107.79 TaxID=1447943 RepID=A0A6A5V7M3_9PLEO|nr:hypothetical protein BU23DRAFT_568679 [Bimuria novae-zelandiae CBS 107.79]